MFISGRKHETSYFGLLEYGVFKFYGNVQIMTSHLNVHLTLCTPRATYVARVGLVVARHAPLKWRTYV